MTYFDERSGNYVASQISTNASTSSLASDTLSSSTKSPPQYESEAPPQCPALRRKFSIEPREDEGREELPLYSCAISLENVFRRKLELEGAVHRAHDRNWYQVYATLQGTALAFHKYKRRGVFEKLGSAKRQSADFPAGAKKGHFLKSYNLQHAEVGIAADYRKRLYVIRIRAEAGQFLLSCVQIETFVNWLHSLFAAIDLAPPLDDREIPRDLSIPRPRNRRTCVRLVGDSRNEIDVESNAELVGEQYETIRRHHPGLLEHPTTQEPGAGISESIMRESPSREEVNPVNHLSNPRAPTRTSSVPAFPSAPLRSSLPELARPSTAPGSHPHPSIDIETGKWRPDHRWSAMYDLVYAKRCMAVLNSRSPRKSNYVILNGEQWIVDWGTGALTRVRPPDYVEVEARSVGKTGGEFRIGQYGTLVQM